MNTAPFPAVQALAPAASKGKILVVDDDRLVLATVSHGLAEAGYEVIDADNGDDAILLAREHRPQLALLDIRMEGKSGFDVAETLRDAYGIPFMFLSALSDPATLAKVQELGAQAYLIKPLDVGQIVPSVAAVLARLVAAAATHAASVHARMSAPTAPAAAASTPPSTAPTHAAAVPARAAAHGPAHEPAQAPAQEPDLAQALAVGVLMHRYSLSRAQAWRRLQKAAEDADISSQAQAQKVVAAMEELARLAL